MTISIALFGMFYRGVLSQCLLLSKPLVLNTVYVLQQ